MISSRILTLLVILKTTAAVDALKTDTIYSQTSDAGYSGQPPETHSNGSLASTEENTGAEHSLHGRDANGVSKNGSYQADLNLLNDGSQLYRRSVWGPQSILQARWERHLLRFRNTMNMEAAKDAEELQQTKDNFNVIPGFPEVIIEVALFADASYMSHLFNLGYDTTKKAQTWFVHKWNTIQGVYKKTGLPVRFKLVKMELWWYDPENYPPPVAAVTDESRLDWFCRNTHQGDGADQKVLYTLDTGNPRYDSWVNVAKTCVPMQNCYLVKSPTLEIPIELHSMGHSLGLHHDNQMKGCTPPQGFMGAHGNYLFKLCYKTAFTKRLKTMNCLRRKDFEDEESLPALMDWMEQLYKGRFDLIHGLTQDDDN